MDDITRCKGCLPKKEPMGMHVNKFTVSAFTTVATTSTKGGVMSGPGGEGQSCKDDYGIP